MPAHLQVTPGHELFIQTLPSVPQIGVGGWQRVLRYLILGLRWRSRLGSQDP